MKKFLLPLLSLSVSLLAPAARADQPAATAPAPPSTEDAQVMHLADAKWKSAAAPHEKVQVSPIAVDPATKGSVGYAKFPAGYQFPTHAHSATETSVLLSGKATFTLDGKAHEMQPGSYVVIPAKTKHSLTCGAGAECVLLTRRAGPTDYIWEK